MLRLSLGMLLLQLTVSAVVDCIRNVSAAFLDVLDVKIVSWKRWGDFHLCTSTISGPVIKYGWAAEKSCQFSSPFFNMAFLIKTTIIKWSEIFNCSRLPAQQTPRGQVLVWSDLSVFFFFLSFLPAAVSSSFLLTCWLHIDLSDARHC